MYHIRRVIRPFYVLAAGTLAAVSLASLTLAEVCKQEYTITCPCDCAERPCNCIIPTCSLNGAAPTACTTVKKCQTVIGIPDPCVNYYHSCTSELVYCGWRPPYCLYQSGSSCTYSPQCLPAAGPVEATCQTSKEVGSGTPDCDPGCPPV